MSNPTREEIIDAHKTLEYLIKNLYDIPLEEAKHTTSYERLAKFLPPKPQPTMAEVERNDDEHHLEEAEHDAYGQVIMLYLDENSGLIRCFRMGQETKVLFLLPSKLTLTGKRYTITETQE